MILDYDGNIGLWAEMVMGRNGYGSKRSWAEMVMGRNDPESIETLDRLRSTGLQ